MTPRRLRLRPMEAGDVAAAARLSAQLGYPAAAETLAARLSGLPRDGALFVAEFEPAEIAGWIHVAEDAALTHDPVAEIKALVVEGRLRRRGVGRALLEAAERWAVSRALTRVRLRSRIEREDAHRFFQACGYHVEKTQRVFSKEPAR